MQALITLTVRSTHFYLLECLGGKLLVDAGWEMAQFAYQLKRYQVPFSAIRYVLFTHHHPDHAGLVTEVRERSGAKLIIHACQVPFLEELHGYAKKMADCRPITVQPDDLISPTRAGLRAIGIAGEIVQTPGHSDDSISLALDSGAAFTGDLPAPFMVGPENSAAVRQSWQGLLDLGCQTFYPSHAGPFDAQAIRAGLLEM